MQDLIFKALRRFASYFRPLWDACVFVLLSFWVSLFWFVYHPDRHFHSLPNGPIFGVRLSMLVDSRDVGGVGARDLSSGWKALHVLRPYPRGCLEAFERL